MRLWIEAFATLPARPLPCIPTTVVVLPRHDVDEVERWVRTVVLPHFDEQPATGVQIERWEPGSERWESFPWR